MYILILDDCYTDNEAKNISTRFYIITFNVPINKFSFMVQNTE